MRRVNKYFEIESEIKKRLKDKRFLSDKNRLLEWVTMDLSSLIKCFEDTIKFFGQDIYETIDVSSINEKKQDIFEVNVSDDSIHEAFIDGICMHISELMTFPSFSNEKNMRNSHLFNEDTRVLLANSFKPLKFGVNQTQLNVMNVNKIKKKVVDNIRIRMKWLKLNEIPEYGDLWTIIIDNNKFKNCVKSIVLYYNNDKLGEKELKGYTIIQMPVRMFNIVRAIKWLEELLDVDRFNIMNMKNKEWNIIKDEMLMNIKILSCIEKSKKEQLASRINKLNSLDRMQKFFATTMNIFDNIYSFKISDKKVPPKYFDFQLNIDTVIMHATIMSHKQLDPEKLNPIVKDFIEPKSKPRYIDPIDLEFID